MYPRRFKSKVAGHYFEVLQDGIVWYCGPNGFREPGRGIVKDERILEQIREETFDHHHETTAFLVHLANEIRAENREIGRRIRV